MFAVASVFYALSIPNQYKATAYWLLPIRMVAVYQAYWVSWVVWRRSGRINIGGGESSESQIAQEIMKSQSFIEKFISDNDLAVEVYAAEGWSKGH